MTARPAALPSYTVLEARLGTGIDRALLDRALTHRSYAYEHGGLPTNERLEFLGDSVLGLVITDEIYRAHPDLQEGQLAKLRASVVNTRALATVARRLELGRWVRIGRGEEVTGGRDKASILADTTEAIIGAVYLDRGIDEVGVVIRTLFEPLLHAALQAGAALDWKTSLQELTAARSLGVPQYIVAESGPDHAKAFTAVALIGGEQLGTGAGKSKKEAEQEAAEMTWRHLTGATGLVGETTDGPGPPEPG